MMLERASMDSESAELSGLMAGPDTGVPKYLRLRNSLADAIAEGRWKPGARIPTEERLTEATGLSLGTVQRALRSLSDQGLVVRRHGTGTFVASSEAPMDAPFQHCRFLDEEGNLLPIYSKFLRRRSAEPGEWSRHLSGRRVLCIERVFSIDREFSIYTHLYFDAERLPALGAAPAATLSGVNVKALLAREHGVVLARFGESLAVATFPADICHALGVKRGTSGAVLEVVARDRKDEAVYFQDFFIPPNARRLAANFSPS